MKLTDYARKVGVSYKTAYRWFKAGKLPGFQMDTGTIIVTDDTVSPPFTAQRIAIYARVSQTEARENLERQASRMLDYCAAKGYSIHKIVKEIGSGVTDSRPKLLALLEDPTITHIVVEHKDRLTRFGFRSIETLLHGQGRHIEVVNQAENGTDDLLHDLTSIIYSMCARLYGQRRAKRKTEQITQELLDENHHAG